MTRKNLGLVLVLVVFGILSTPVSAGASDGYRSVDAIIAGSETPSGPIDRMSTPDTYLAQLGISPQASSEPAVVSAAPVGGGDGFDWGDALIGAATTSGLLLITFAAARSLTRHREATVESSA